MDTPAHYALQEALDDYVDAAIEYRESNREFRSSRDRDAAGQALVSALDALIALRIRQIGQVTLG